MPRPAPPYSSRDQRREIAACRQRIDKSLRICAGLVDIAPIGVGESGADFADRFPDCLTSSSLACTIYPLASAGVDSLKVLFEPFEDRFHRFIRPFPYTSKWTPPFSVKSFFGSLALL